MVGVEQKIHINGRACTLAEEAKMGVQLRHELEEYRAAVRDGTLPGDRSKLSALRKPGITPTDVRLH